MQKIDKKFKNKKLILPPVTIGKTRTFRIFKLHDFIYQKFFTRIPPQKCWAGKVYQVVRENRALPDQNH